MEENKEGISLDKQDRSLTPSPEVKPPYQQYQGQANGNSMHGVPPQRQSNGMAIAAMILGIVSIVSFCSFFLCFICAVIAIILGIMGLNTSKSTGEGRAILQPYDTCLLLRKAPLAFYVPSYWSISFRFLVI